MIWPRKETQNSLLSNTKKCETFIEQIFRKPEEIMEFKLNKPRETFHFNPPISVEEGSSGMVGLKSLELCNSVFNMTEKITLNFIRILLTSFHPQN